MSATAKNGNVSGAITSAGDAAVFASENVTGNIQAGVNGRTLDADGKRLLYFANVEAYGSISSTVNATGSILAGAYKNISGQFTPTESFVKLSALYSLDGVVFAKTDATATGDTISNFTITAQTGDASVSSSDTVDATVVSGKSATVSGVNSARATVTSGTDATVTSLGLIAAGTRVNAGGDVVVSAGTTLDVTAATGVDVTLTAIENATIGTATASRDFTIIAFDQSVFQNVSAGRDGSIQGSIVQGSASAVRNLSVLATDGVQDGSHFTTTAGDLSAVALGQSMGIHADMNSGGNVYVDSGAALTGSISSMSNATIRAQYSITASVTSTNGVVSVTALGGGLTGNVSAGKDAFLTINGPVTGTTTSLGGDVTAFVFGSVNGAISAYKSADVTSWGSLPSDITATTGSATVWANNTIGGNVSAGIDASVSTGPYGTISGNTTAGRDASVFTWGAIAGNVVSGRDASVWSKGSFTGLTTAGRDADMTVAGSIAATISAGRNATIWLRNDLTGAVQAGNDVTVTAYGSISAPIVAGNNANVTVWSVLTSPVVAVAGSATIWAMGSVLQSITAGLAVDLQTMDSLIGNVTAGTNATVWVRNNVTAATNVEAGNDVTATVMGNMSGLLKAGNDVTAFVLGEYGNGQNSIDAGRDAKLTVMGQGVGWVFAKRNTDIYAGGKFNGGAAGVNGSVSIYSLDDLTAEIHAGTSANITSLTSYDGKITAGTDVSVWGFQNVHSEVTAGKDVNITSWAKWTGKVKSGGSVDVFGYSSAFGDVTADQSVSFTSAGNGNANIHAGTSVDAFVRNDFSGFINAGTNVSVVVGGNGGNQYSQHGSGLAIVAGNDANLIVGGKLGGSVHATNDVSVQVFGNGGGVGIIAGRDAFFNSLGSLDDSAISAGRDATFSTWGSAKINVTAGRDASIWTHHDFDGIVTAFAGNAAVDTNGNQKSTILAGKDVRVASLGTLETYASGSGIDLFAVEDITGSANGTGAVSAQSYGDIRVSASGKSLDIMSVGNIEGIFSAVDDIRIGSYGSMKANVSAGRDITEVSAVGGITGDYRAGRDVVYVGTYGNINAVIAANGTYVDPDGTSTAKVGNIGTLKARGTIAGKSTAANAIGTVAGGSISAQITRGDGLSVVVDANNASLAASTPPADWLAGVLAESDALFATVLADAAALQTELSDWVNSLTANRSGIAATIALEKSTAADDLALLHSQLASGDAELLAMHASILSQIDGELSVAYAEAMTANSVARTAAIQWFGDAQSAAILERAITAAAIAASKVTAIQTRNLDRASALLARSKELTDAAADVAKLTTERTTHAARLKVVYYLLPQNRLRWAPRTSLRLSISLDQNPRVLLRGVFVSGSYFHRVRVFRTCGLTGDAAGETPQHLLVLRLICKSFSFTRHFHALSRRTAHRDFAPFSRAGFTSFRPFVSESLASDTQRVNTPIRLAPRTVIRNIDRIVNRRETFPDLV